MKGDFTRFTFQPNKQYTSVLMQQGRLQLDADWNEQMSIWAYLNRVRTRDTIGASAGTSETEGGFEISTTPGTPGGDDLIIKPGRFYLEGILCELIEGNELQSVQLVEDSTSNKIRVPYWVLDGIEFAEKQWIEILPPIETTNANGKRQIDPQIYRVDRIDSELQILTLDSNKKPQGNNLNLRRLTTYKTQPDYPNPSPNSDNSTALTANKKYLVYLDAWTRHITVIEDSSLREVALQVPDTTTRTKTVWQVKLLKLADDFTVDSNQKPEEIIETIKKRAEWQQLTGEYRDPKSDRTTGRKVYLTASTDRNPGTQNSTPGEYQGTDNRLYRIEIHTPGALGTATFKWARDNASTVSEIEKIDGDTIHLISPIKEIDSLFDRDLGKSSPWVEIISEEQELNNQLGALVRLIKAKPDRLTFDRSIVRGNLPTSSKLKVRRWHDTSEGEILTNKDEKLWIPLEDGIGINFKVGNFIDVNNNNNLVNYEFKTGDFWLIPARESTRTIAWTQDEQGRWQPQPPAGIEHYYTPLALATAKDENSFEPEIKDFRIKFPTLVNCFDKTGDFIPDSLGVGFKGSPQATLQVAGNDRQPIVRFDRNNGNTEFLINSEGNIGIGTNAIASNTKLDIKGNTQVTGDLNVANVTKLGNITLQGNDTTGSTIASTQNLSLSATGDLSLNAANIRLNGNFQLDRARFTNLGVNIDPPSGSVKLQVDGEVKIGKDNNYVTLLPPTAANPVKFTTDSNSGYEFDRKIKVNGDIAIESGNLQLPADAKIESNNTLSLQSRQLLLQSSNNASIKLENDSIELQGNLDARRSKFDTIGINIDSPNINSNIKLQVEGSLKITNSNRFFQIVPPENPSDSVKLTTSAAEGYQFDRTIEIKDGVSIEKENIVFNILNSENKIVADDKLTLQASEVLIPSKLLIGNPTGAPAGVKLFVAGSATANILTANEFKVFSSQTLKDNITQLSSSETRQTLQALNPVKFTYKADGDRTIQWGFIAEDVPSIIASADRQAINPVNIVAALTKIVQDHDRAMLDMIRVLKQQKQEIATLNQKIQSLENEIVKS